MERLCFLQMELLQQSLLESAFVGASFRGDQDFCPTAPGSSPRPCRAKGWWKDFAVADVAAHEVSPSAPRRELPGAGSHKVRVFRCVLAWSGVHLERWNFSRRAAPPGPVLMAGAASTLTSRGSSIGLGCRQTALPSTE